MPAHDPYAPARRATVGATAITATPGQMEGEPDYEAMDKRGLIDLAKQRGLKTWGTVSQLVGRLQTWDREQR